MSKTKQTLDSITVRFAGDSGDGMQLAGDRLTDVSAVMGNDFVTFPDYPAEIRAPVGSLGGVSSFQIRFSQSLIFTPGDEADVLVAMNPAALKVNVKNIRKGGLVIVNTSAFTETNLKRASATADFLQDPIFREFTILSVPLGELTRSALKELDLKNVDAERCKNFFALGVVCWLYGRKLETTLEWIEEKFSKSAELVQANTAVLKAGYTYADVSELLPTQYFVPKAKLEPGMYRKIVGNDAISIGLITGAHLAGKTLFYGSYPITPATEILQFLAAHKSYGVKTYQAEDEIAAIGAALGASFAGNLGVTGTSGPGMCLKSEVLNLAVVVELPLVIVDVQRGGPSTGIPTKMEQGDLLQSVFGRNSNSPLVVLALITPGDGFTMAVEAVRLAIKYMTPVILLSDGFLANSSEPWKLPEIEKLPDLRPKHPEAVPGKTFFPYSRDPQTLARPWAIPGTPGLEHRVGGLSKADQTGYVSYDPENQQKMVNFRAEKIRRIATDIPPVEVRGPGSGKTLVLGWGSSYGAIFQVINDLNKDGHSLSQAHLNYLNPFPANLGEILNKFEQILVPELNMGQLLVLLRYEFPNKKFIGIHQMNGQPFKVHVLGQKIREYL